TLESAHQTGPMSAFLLSDKAAVPELQRQSLSFFLRSLGFTHACQKLFEVIIDCNNTCEKHLRIGPFNARANLECDQKVLLPAHSLSSTGDWSREGARRGAEEIGQT